MNVRYAGKKAAGKFVLIIILIAAAAGCGNARSGSKPSHDQSELISYLSRVLDEKLAEYGTADRAVAAAPSGASGRVDNLSYDSQNQTLSWTYKNTGDYDLSGEVGVSDITPIALHWLAKTNDTLGDDALEAWIDGDASGEVAVGDITPIAINYLSEVAGYRILTSDSADGSFTQIGSDIPFGATGQFPKGFTIPVPSGALAFVAVAPYDSAGAQGIRSNAVAIAGDVPPQISSISPQGGDSGGVVQFSASVFGTAPFDYSWDFGGGAVPNTTIDPSPTVTLGATGIYSASVTVTNSAGNDTYDFNLYVVGSNTPPQIFSVSPLAGEATSNVQFSAEVSGSSPLSYAWDFGGGADPDASNSPSPAVALSAAGSYDCSLTVTNPYGSDAFDFTLDISPYNAPPVAQASVTPIIGDSPLTATLLSTGSSDPDGAVVLYEWDFDSDGTYDYSTPSPAPIEHVYPGEAAGGPYEGKYRARLRVTDDGGKTATAETPEFISNDAHLYWTWEYVDGGAQAGYAVSGGSVNIDPRDGRPCIVYRAEDVGWKIKAAWRNNDGTYEFDQYDFGHMFSMSNAAMKPDGTMVLAVHWYDEVTMESQLSAIWRTPDGVWTDELVDSEGIDIGRDPRIALNDMNLPGVIYSYSAVAWDIPANQVRYAFYNGIQWQVEITDIDVTQYTDQMDCLVYNGSTPFAIVSDDILLTFERSQAGIWTESVLDASAPTSFVGAAALTLNGQIQILAGMDETNQVYWYGESGSGWNRELVFDGIDEHHWIMPGFPGIYAHSGRTYAAFSFYDQPYIMYFCYSIGSAWRQEAAKVGLDAPAVSNQLVVRNDGSVVLALFDSQTREVMLGIRQPTG
ncbi:MAG: PKD domain-containing protein [bacterium]|jgi:PKD repeat protein